MKVGYSTNAWGSVLAHWGAPNNPNSAYYYCSGSLADAVAGIAAAGFDSVEIFDGNLMDYVGKEAELQALLDKHHVKMLGVYSAAAFIYDEILDEELFRLKKAAEFAKKFGATEWALGGGATRYNGIKEGDYKKCGEGLDKVVKIAEDLGMTASYHPHMGSLIESPEQIDKLMAHTRIPLCPDLAHIVAGAKGDASAPLAVVKKYKDRIKYVHLKDITPQGNFCPLGVGVIDFKPIIDVLGLNNGKGPVYAIECDGWQGGKAEDGCKITAKYLTEKLGFV
jgi:inosose dehydratase